MNAHNRGVNHLDGSIMSSSQCVHDTAPHASPTPANEAIVASGIGAELLWQIAPRCARSQDPKDAVHDTAVVYPWDSTGLVRQHRLDTFPPNGGGVPCLDYEPPLRPWIIGLCTVSTPCGLAPALS